MCSCYLGDSQSLVLRANDTEDFFNDFRINIIISFKTGSIIFVFGKKIETFLFYIRHIVEIGKGDEYPNAIFLDFVRVKPFVNGVLKIYS